MKKIKNNIKIKFLEKEYEKALQDLKDLHEFYSFYLGNELNFSNVLKRSVDGTLSTNDKQFFNDLLKCHRNLHEIEERINHVRSIETYKDQIHDSYFSYITQQELRRMMDDGDASAKCYERFIPDEVETGFFATEEDRIIAEQTYACYKDFKTQQEENIARDIIDASVEKYASYIPDDVETGINIDSLKRLAESAESLEKEIYGDEEHKPNRMLLPEPVNGVTSFPITRSRNQ